MNGKGSKPRAQILGPDGKTPNGRYADNWSAVFGDEETTGPDRTGASTVVEVDPSDGAAPVSTGEEIDRPRASGA